MNQGTNHANRGPGGGERGSALILAILIMVIMTLLGFSYLLLADTENQIAINERNYAQALYVAESGVRIVKTWFDQPGDPDYQFPDVTDTTNVIRNLRMVDDDDDPGTARVPAVQGNAAKPFYRDGTDDLFEKSYRGNLAVAFSGSEAGPDLRITGDALDGLNDLFFPDFPSPTRRARITMIEVYEPPVFTIGANQVRYGIATVKVTAGVFLFPGTAAETQVAERVVKAILNETPYPKPAGPLQSCTDLAQTGEFRVHWGPTIVNDAATINANLDNKNDSGFPWENRFIHISGTNPGDDLYEWADFAVNNDPTIEDPWAGFIAGGTVTGLDPGAFPYPFVLADVVALGTIDKEHSNISQSQGSDQLPCPDMDYAYWKEIALRGGSKIHYFTHDTADKFFLEGQGTSKAFSVWTDVVIGEGAGFYFFDTADGNPPTDTDADGFADNLTPGFTINGLSWAARGLIYMNVSNFQTAGISDNDASRPDITMIAPGEPYVDANYNQQYDDGEVHLNITYPAVHTDGYTLDGVTPLSTSIADYEATGGGIVTDAALSGVLYNSGQFNPQGNAVIFGSIIAREGMSGGAGGTPDIYFDERIIKDEWPPADLELPRVVITSWETDL